MANQRKANQDTELIGKILDSESLRSLFNPSLVFVYGSSVKERKADKRKTHSDIDLLIVTNEWKNETDFGRSHALNTFCNLTSKYLDVIWLSKSRFAELTLHNESFKRFFGDLQLIYVGDRKWSRN